MRPLSFALVAASLMFMSVLTPAAAAGPAAAKVPSGDSPKPWCAPEVSELDDHVCYFDGGAPSDGRHTLVIYLHGMLATTPGFFWLQERAMALHAKRHNFTVLMPASPKTDVGYVWPTSQVAQREQEAAVVEGLRKDRTALEKRVGHTFDETFVVGFSSGAYYASSLALRGVLDVQGYIVLAGGSTWPRGAATTRRAPVFVGVSAADAQTADDSRAFARSLAALGWPHHVEERNAGHMVDWTFMAHGIGWLRSQRDAKLKREASLPAGADMTR